MPNFAEISSLIDSRFEFSTVQKLSIKAKNAFTSELVKYGLSFPSFVN